MPPNVLNEENLTAPSKSVIDNPAPVQMRAFGDALATRKAIYDNVLTAARAVGPISNVRHTLSLSGVDYADPEEVSKKKQKEAILSGKSLHRRLRGTWRLTDNESGKVLDEQHTTVAQVPYMTDRGTFIMNGSDYVLRHQMRLNPGVFTRIKENGELEAHVNVLPGKGISQRYFLDPESGVFKINIGQAKLPLIPVLRAMGVKDTELRDHWGPAILQANAAVDDARVIDKLYARLVRRGDPNAESVHKRQAVADTISRMELDPEVTKRTLGTPHKNITPQAIIDTTKKLLRVSKGEVDPDDRDHLAFQTLYGPEDLLAERFAKDKSYLRQLLWRATTKSNLSHIQPGALTRQLHAALLHSGLGQATEEINPAELLDGQTGVTRLGEGGIPNMEAVPDESRNVQPSHFAFIDPIRTPESFKVGVDTRLATAARKGSDGRIYAPFMDVRSGKNVYKSPQDLTDKVVAFPGEMAKGEPYVAAQARGTTRFVPRDKVDFELPHFENAFSPLANMIPLKSAVKGQRMAMGSRYLAQALPLVSRESPFVQTGVPGSNGERSYEEEFAHHLGAVHAKGQGRVTKITPDEIHVKYADGTTRKHELYNNFPYARKTFIHNEPVVNVGDPVKDGQLLAGSNFTDDKGAAALGLNARIAFVPMSGANYEDAAVISESMRKRLASEHMYQHEQEWSARHAKGKRAYISLFPGAYDRKALGNMDDLGVVKPGTTLNYGDPIVLAAEAREMTHSKVHRGRKPSYADKTQTWDHHAPGVVTDVVHTPGGATVAVKSINEINVGDKLSNRYGGKGVVSMILPDDQMPHDAEGKHYEMLLNPLGVISRINPAQVAEAVLGKIAAKTGKRYKVEDFKSDQDLVEFARTEAQKYGVQDKEPVFDPTTGRQIKDPFTGKDPLSGYQFILKLHHMAESKGQGRGTGAYTSEEVPAKGGTEGSKRIALLETNALLSHGATEVLRDAHLVRGQKNENYWQAYMSGFRPPDPQVPFVYRKFVNTLQASGINPVREGGQMHVMALTDKDVTHMAGDREIQNPETVDWKEGLKPRKGGLFDPELTGGHNGTRWSYIKLHEPLPNPAFEEPIRRLLGLTQAKLEGIIAGQEQYNGQTGPRALWNALKGIDVKKELQRARTEIKGTRATARDAAVRRLGYLKTLDRLDMHPSDWMQTKVPVLPPAFRPVSVMAGSGTQLVSDPNYLYRELLEANDVLKQLHGQVDDLSQERLNTYHALKGVVGLGDPIQPKNQERRVKGLLRHVFGSSPKLGVVQRQLLGATVDVVGRAVITPNPDLDMDHVGLPESKAWNVYQNFIVRRLVRRGVPRLEAVQAVKDRKDMAKHAMTEEMKERPVIISRAPVLHKFGIQAFWPRLTKGDVMEISPLVTKGFNADFDGDMMNYHVPASEEAKREAVEKMLPSRNLFGIADFKVHYVPSQEYTGGLFTATTAHDKSVKRPRVFATIQDARAAYERGEIGVDTPVEVVKH
jgi:DNA-directed RNA polymerase beta subunit